MIGIICAEKQELDEILKLMSNKSEEIFSFFEFIKGKINNQDCVVALSGVGKVSSAICAQTLILKYCPNFILNVGVAGGIAENINILILLLPIMWYSMTLMFLPFQIEKKVKYQL